MSIAEAKRELYNHLTTSKAVRGAGIREKNGSEYIVIFQTEPRSNVPVNIPSSYKGNRVVTELTSAPRSL